MPSGPIAALAFAFALAAAACDEKTAPRAAPPSARPAAPVSPTEACADAWLAAHQRNPFGDPEGTSYAGGTPLFDERSGVRTDRLQHLLGKLPDQRAACAARDGG